MNSFKEKLKFEDGAEPQVQSASLRGPPAGQERLSEGSKSARRLPRGKGVDTLNGLWQLFLHIFTMEEWVEARETEKEESNQVYLFKGRSKQEEWREEMSYPIYSISMKTTVKK